MAEKVIIFTTPTCGECKAAKGFLAKLGVAFEEVDVSKDGKARYRVRKLTGRTRTPVFMIGDHVIDGFNPERLKMFLNQSIKMP